MDPLSQGIVGSVFAQNFSKEKLRIAALTGCVGGMLADLDIFIRSKEDTLLQLEYHRHFTHSLIFIPVGGLIAAFILWPLLRRWSNLKELYIFGTAGYATSGLLDACTSYGTRLLWPFSDERIAWCNIAIIDPVFTFTLIALTIAALFRKGIKFSQAALVFMVLYLLFGVYQRETAEDAALLLAKSRKHEVERISVKPSIFNQFVWRSTYENNGKYYVDAIRVIPFGSPEYIPGDTVETVKPDDYLTSISTDSVLYRDIKRFEHFSDSYLIRHPDYENIVGDARYGMLPNSTRPLWGIEVDLEKSNEHAEYKTFRKAGKNPEDQMKARLKRLWDMIKGKGAIQLPN